MQMREKMKKEAYNNSVPITRHRTGENLFENANPKFQEYRKRWNEQPSTFQHGEFPLFLDIETTNICNFKCTFCSNQFIPTNDLQYITDDKVSVINFLSNTDVAITRLGSLFNRYLEIRTG